LRGRELNERGKEAAARTVIQFKQEYKKQEAEGTILRTRGECERRKCGPVFKKYSMNEEGGGGGIGRAQPKNTIRLIK